MKTHIGMDAASGLIHTVFEVNSLLHGQEGDAGYQGVDRRPDMPVQTPERKIAMKRSKRKALGPEQPVLVMQERLEQVKSKTGPRSNTHSE